ncbi:putative transducin family protein / WD-40 repeat family protein [Heracleum sosnowskyi]|uniref:Transducin family protein / WD-40 repeat family protein n=1 Tax=Heracleum sosnowskyi TaxID=360622 RepID=A0AAD8J487_9APIA|nr:putative transducin family protein / WD-40 repeat family protein [Heracleum sosnowskyi]
MINKLFQNFVQSPKREEKKLHRSLTLEPRVVLHYGIPSTASILAFDPYQHLLAIATTDGRIKVIGGDYIEALLIAPKPSSFKNLEFLHNQGFLVSVTNENEVQVWDLEQRRIAAHTQWESNITAFSTVYGFHYMYVGDEYGFLSVLKFDAQEGNLQQLPYYIAANVIADGAGVSLPDHLSVVGLLPQPCSSGDRVLIAYANGFIILWDITEDQAVLVSGHKDLQLKNAIVVNSSNDVRHEHSEGTSDNNGLSEKEISSLCWVSSDGSVLAVGYVDGDILLWNLTNGASTKDSQNKGPKGQLFVYGGDEIGSKEVLTILTLDWLTGIETLICIARIDLTLGGSFADMTLVPSGGSGEHGDASTLFVLTNPGQLHFYNDACLSVLMSKPNETHSADAIQYPALVPTTEPNMSVGKLSVLDEEALSATKLRGMPPKTSTSTNWPLTGSIPSQLSSEYRCKRIYIGGYEDGSVRVWDATFPVLSLVSVIESRVAGVELVGSGSSVSVVDFSSSASNLAIGDESGLVRLYSLMKRSEKSNIHIVTETKQEVHNVRNGGQNQCVAVFSLVNSPVRSLQFVTSGARLAIGFECCQVAMLDVSSSKLLFLTDCISRSSSPLVSLIVKSFPDTLSNSLDLSKDEKSIEPVDEVAFILTKNAHITIIDSTRGDVISALPTQPKKESTALSMYIVEGNNSIREVSERHLPNSSQDSQDKSKSATNECQSDNKEVSINAHYNATNLGQRFNDSSILLCCDNGLHLYSLNSVDEKMSIRKLELSTTCCWTTIFETKEKDLGLILFYQTGLIEIRSLPDFELVGETSFNSILKWTFKNNINKTMSSSGTGQITMVGFLLFPVVRVCAQDTGTYSQLIYDYWLFQLNVPKLQRTIRTEVNGREFAVISLLAFENDFRIPEALPSLHNRVLAAAADSAVTSSLNQKKKQITTTGILSGFIKGFNIGKEDQSVDIYKTRESFVEHLDCIFSRFPFSDSLNIPDGDHAEYSIDDAEIDEPIQISPPSVQIKVERKDKELERERLFEGGSADSKPKLRTADEVRAKYRKAGDVSAVAAQAKDKLIERQEKLEKLSKNSEELQSESENFASLSKELAKRMENRKWWQL